jgi:RNA polymerase sigma-70 factor, ECF subfamily
MDTAITDIQLLEKVKNTDGDAFQLLYHRYQPIIFRYVLFLTAEKDFSHDIVQETFIRVWEHRRSIKPHDSFLAYIFRISKNLIRDAARHQKIRERADATLAPPALSEQDDPVEALHLTIVEEKITEVIHHHLPERCREIFLLSRFEGKTHQEIAEILQLSVRTVEHQISHALTIMRKKLKDF